MHWIVIFFWFSILVVLYTFFGYAIFLYLFVLLKRLIKPAPTTNDLHEPPITLVIPCFNEADIMESKIANCRALEYPAGKLSIAFITDGSTDHFMEIIKKHPDIKLLHDDHRAGKTAAENRAMHFVRSPFVIFSDANTLLNPGAICNMVKHFADEKVGCVAGEKRILTNESDNASAAGESMYWKYESILKKLDSAFYSAVGAAGELVAFRSSLYKELPEDTLLDDFMQSMQIAAAGYKIMYEPEAFAIESASINVEEELKRKIRISTGSWQAMQRLRGVLRFTKTPLLFFQYFSHRILRWAVVPFLLILIFFLNISLVIGGTSFYALLLLMQLIFYGIAVAGYLLRNKKIYIKSLFMPYYFCVMHYAVLVGLQRFLSGDQKGTWEKAERKMV